MPPSADLELGSSNKAPKYFLRYFYILPIWWLYGSYMVSIS